MEYQDFFQLIITGKLNDIMAAIAAGYDINRPDQWGFLPLHRACANDQKEIVMLLIEKGSKLNARATDEWTPLHLASISGALDCLTHLVKAGADINAVDINGCIPLHLATTYWNPELPTKSIQLVKLLIALGSNKYKRNKNGLTPLDYAKKSGHNELYELLN